MVDDELVAGELEALLVEALSRFGTAGAVTVTGAVATLHGNGPTVSLDASALLAAFRTLPPDERKRRVNDLARKLAAERRALGTSSAPASRGGLPAWAGPSALGLGSIVAVAAAIHFYRVWMTEQDAAAAQKAAVVADYDAYERERASRAARVCEATRTRVMRGASVGPSDVEGWVAELWGLRSADKGPLVGEAAVARFVVPHEGGSAGRIVWKEAKALAAIEGPSTTVRVEAANLPEEGPPRLHGLRITFTGRYVAPYFDEAGRPEYVRLAHGIAEALALDYGALYARCEQGNTHHLGSWFRGPTPGGAAGALVFFLGAFGEPPELREGILVPEGEREQRLHHAFEGIKLATVSLKKGRVMTMIGAEGGMIAGADGAPAAITFPLRDANRAGRASHAIARELGLAAAR